MFLGHTGNFQCCLYVLLLIKVNYALQQLALTQNTFDLVKGAFLLLIYYFFKIFAALLAQHYLTRNTTV